MASINPYLNFNGTCEAAFNHYKSVFGGEFQMLSRFADMPASEEPIAESDANLIMHVSLPIGTSGNTLMGSDCPPSFPNGVQGNLFNVSVSAESKEEADQVFAGLSEGGTVFMPMADTFWGSYFGMCTDQFGVQWMVGFDYPRE